MISQVDIIYPTPPSMEPHMNDQSPHQRADTAEMMTEDNFRVSATFGVLSNAVRV